MEETVNALGIENGDPKNTYSFSEDNKKGSETGIADDGASECVNNSLVPNPNMHTSFVNKASQEYLSEDGGGSDNTLKSESVKSQSVVAAQDSDLCLDEFTQENAVCELKNDNHPVGSHSNSCTGDGEKEKMDSDIATKKSVDQEVSTMEENDNDGRKSNNIIIDMNTQVEINFESDSNTNNQIGDGAILITDEKLENIESELLLLTGDTSPPAVDSQFNKGRTPIENENIISELSVIHGEQSATTIHNGGGDNQYSFITVTPEDIIKVYDQNINIKPKEDKMLINTLMKLVDGRSKQDIPEEEAVMNNLQLLALLEEGTEPPSSLKEENKSFRTEAPIRKYRKSFVNMDPILEKTLALKQLKELPVRKSPKNKSKIVDVKIPKVAKRFKIVQRPTMDKNNSLVQKVQKDSEKSSISTVDKFIKHITVKTYSKKGTSSDISNLINDWSDDDGKQEHQLNNNSQCKESIVSKESTVVMPESPTFVEPTPKRVARVIKKKVIYDPDNPDSYKFASTIIKKDALDKRIESESEQNENTKANSPTQKAHITKTKTKIMALSGGSPQGQVRTAEAKTTKRNSITPINKKKSLNITVSTVKKKKLTEVDRLLMDEGAVNMIYQLERSNNNSDVPELALKPNKKSLISISKEKRAMVSKTKIIKQAVMTQSNDSNIKIFRARKESRASNYRDSTSQKVAGLRSSMQSPSLSEVSTAGIGGHESKIIRRHSSSSFSSGGLSPRPQSPIQEMENRKLMAETSLDETVQLENDSGIQSSTPLAIGSIRKRQNALATMTNSVKKKKQSLENVHVSVRQKKVTLLKNLDIGIPSPIACLGKLSSFTQLTLDISDNIAHITVKPTGNSEELYDLQVLSELTEAVRLSSSTNAVLLTSGDGALCGGLDLRCLLHPTLDQQRASADQLVDTFSELMVSLCECHPAVVCGVGGACSGPGVALLTLCDLALASDRATFCVAPRPRRSLPPEGVALLARPHSLPPQVARELVMCGRKLTASEALQRGLVARTLWPDRFLEEIRSIAVDLAQHPPQSFAVIKSVLRRGEVASVTAALRQESRQLVDLWCTPEGQDAIRETHAHL